MICFSLIFIRSYLHVQTLGDRHPNTMELGSWLVHVLCNSKATWHQEAYFSVSWIHHGNTSCWCLCFTFLVKVLPPPFHYSLGNYLYLFFVIHLTKWKLIAKYKHKIICINNTQLTIFYCYSATNSITNLSNK